MNTLVKQALGNQVGGSHYTNMKISPLEYIEANNIGFSEGNIIKYISRYKEKNGLEDLYKARQYLDVVIKREKENATKDDQKDNR